MTIINMTYWKWGSPLQPFHLNWISDLAAVEWNQQATITWTDAWDLVVDWQTLANWASTKLVRKTWSAPTDSSDWTLVVTETVKDTYSVSGYVDTGLTNNTTYYYWAFGVSTEWLETISNIANVTPRPAWQPWANTIWYYTFDDDMLNHATTGSLFPDWNIGTAEFSTTRVHWNHTKSLYCDGTTYAYLPADSNYVFWTNDFTVSVRVYSLTNSWNYTWFISNYNDSFWWDSKQWYRISDRFGSQNKLNFCWNAWSGGSDIWVDGTTNTPIYNDGWHNVVLSRTSGVFNLYLDWNTTPVYTNSSYTTKWIGKNNRIYLGVNASDTKYSVVYMNDLIYENVGWSAQDVNDYYNLTS